MLAHLSATDIAFAMIALMQGVICLVWLLGSWVIGDVRRAAQHWAAFAGLSALSFVALATALHLPVPTPGEHLRAVGNLCGVVAMVALHRGVRLFVDRPPPTAFYALVLCAALVASGLGVLPAYATLRVSVNSAALLSLIHI